MPNTPQSEELVLKNPYYFLHIYKVKGHRSWRAHLALLPDGFEKQKQPNYPEVTEMRVVRIDRVTGQIITEGTTDA